MGQQPENEVPLKSIGQYEDGVENGQISNEFPAAENRRKGKGFKSMKWIRIGTIVLGLILAVILLAYLIYTNLLKGGPKSHTHIDPSGRGLTPPNPEVTQSPSSSPLLVFEKTAICSDSEICSNNAKEFFRRGANVVDVAIATLLCNGITTMQSLGIGGGFVMNVFLKSQNRAYTIDAREVAGYAATEDMFAGKPNMASMNGNLAIAVPGEVMGYHEAYKQFGSLPWKDIVEPSIKLCEGGIVLSEHMSDSLRMNEKFIRLDAHLSKMFVNNGTGEFYKPGRIVMPPKELCNTYRMLAENGPTDFYNGTLSKMIAQDLEDIGSIVTHDDLLSYRADVVSSISVPLNNDVLHVVPPVGSGTIVGMILNILRGYNFTAASIANFNETALTYHRFAEAFKFGYSKRWDFGDLRFNDLRMLIRNLTTPEHGEDYRMQIDDAKTYDDPKHYGAKFTMNNETGTSHISIIAPNGDAVSVTSSINYYFGAGFCGKRTGIIFNSGMDDFSKPGVPNYFGLPPSKANFIRPQKRAMSSMAPTIVSDREGNVKLVIGSAGGSKIISSVVSIIARVLWFGQDIKQAIDAPRLHHQVIPNILEYEFGLIEGLVRSLESKGHSMRRIRGRGTAMCGMSKNATAVYANADYRKKGGVAGY